MATPETILIVHEDFEDARFSHVGRHSGGQFLAYLTYAAPKHFWREESASDEQIIWRQYTNCFAVLHKFDSLGRHRATEVERVSGTADSDDLDWSKLNQMLSQLGEVMFGDIRVCLFQVEVNGIVHGLIHECHRIDDDTEEQEWVMLQPNDVMFHPPWDSGEYST